MEHFHHSSYRGYLENYDIITDETSYSCGDHIIFTVQCSGYKVAAIKFTGDGSIIGQAAASILCEKVQGMDFQAILALTTDDLAELLGIELGINRLRTVVFVLQGLQKGIRSYMSIEA